MRNIKESPDKYPQGYNQQQQDIRNLRVGKVQSNDQKAGSTKVVRASRCLGISPGGKISKSVKDKTHSGRKDKLIKVCTPGI